MSKLRVLLVGAAFSADLHSDGYSRILDKVQIVGICDKDLSRIEALANRYGFTGYTAYDNYDDAIAQCDCDLVDICMPNFLHHDVAIKAMNAFEQCTVATIAHHNRILRLLANNTIVDRFGRNCTRSEISAQI